MKTRIYAAPAVKGLKGQKLKSDNLADKGLMVEVAGLLKCQLHVPIKNLTFITYINKVLVFPGPRIVDHVMCQPPNMTEKEQIERYQMNKNIVR